jgi:hypothetical protein
LQRQAFNKPAALENPAPAAIKSIALPTTPGTPASRGVLHVTEGKNNALQDKFPDTEYKRGFSLHVD